MLWDKEWYKKKASKPLLPPKKTASLKERIQQIQTKNPLSQKALPQIQAKKALPQLKVTKKSVQKELLKAKGITSFSSQKLKLEKNLKALNADLQRDTGVSVPPTSQQKGEDLKALQNSLTEQSSKDVSDSLQKLGEQKGSESFEKSLAHAKTAFSSTKGLALEKGLQQAQKNQNTGSHGLSEMAQEVSQLKSVSHGDSTSQPKGSQSNSSLSKKPLGWDGFKDFRKLRQLPGNPKPSYPYKARKRKVEGLVYLTYFVNSNGFVEKLRLYKSSGFPILDRAAMESIKRYRYKKGDSGWVIHDVRFRLLDEKTVEAL